MDHQQPDNDPENSSDLLLSLSQPRTQTPHMLVHYETTGTDANAALDALADLVARGFDEDISGRHG